MYRRYTVKQLEELVKELTELKKQKIAEKQLKVDLLEEKCKDDAPSILDRP